GSRGERRDGGSSCLGAGAGGDVLRASRGRGDRGAASAPAGADRRGGRSGIGDGGHLVAARARDAAAGCLVVELGVGTIRAFRNLLVPVAGLVLVFDSFGGAGVTLALGGGRGGGVSVPMSWEGFRQHVANLIGPAAIVLDDLVNHLRHELPLCVACP